MLLVVYIHEKFGARDGVCVVVAVDVVVVVFAPAYSLCSFREEEEAAKKAEAAAKKAAAAELVRHLYVT